jgi:hypothetical protein
MNTGYDSAYAPTLPQAQLARSIGAIWWGFYLPRITDTDPLNGWTPGQMDVLEQAGIIPVPIVVPEPPHPADPVATATTAFQQCLAYGLTPSISVCYDGEHISASGPVWLPIPGPRPTAVGPQSAIQYGSANVGGLNVDVNASSLDFPAKQALVCDLEHAASYDSQWYATFQNTVANLAKGHLTRVASAALPSEAYPIVSASAAWAGTGRLDVVMVGHNGAVYHKWWDGTSWSGPDQLDKAV